MVDTDRLLRNALGGGAAAGLLSQVLRSRKGRRMGTKLLKVGAVAAIGGLAYAAWKNYQNKQNPSAEVSERRFLPEASDTEAQDSLGMTLTRAMIAAARADGELDAEERKQIMARLDELQLPPAERTTVVNEIDHPVDVDTLVKAATTPEIASEIYVASRLAIDVDTPAEQAYLQLLAARLGLEDGLVAELDRQLDAI